MWADKLFERWRARRGTVLAALALVLLAGAGAWYRWGARTLPVYVVASGDIVQSIVASGRVETPLRSNWAARSPAPSAPSPSTRATWCAAGSC